MQKNYLPSLTSLTRFTHILVTFKQYIKEAQVALCNLLLIKYMQQFNN